MNIHLSIHHQYLLLGLILIASLVELIVVIRKRLRSNRLHRKSLYKTIDQSSNMDVVNYGNTTMRIIKSYELAKTVNLYELEKSKQIQGVVDAKHVVLGKSNPISFVKNTDQVQLVNTPN